MGKDFRLNKHTNATDAAVILGCHQSTVSRWVKRLKIGKRYGNALVLSASDIRALRSVIRQHQNQ